MKVASNRREFFQRVAVLGGATALAAEGLFGEGQGNPKRNADEPIRGRRPVVISSANGYKFGATETAYTLLQQGADPLDAVIAGVNRNENDPNDDTVGYGGLPNEDGVVQLDACVMHGPSGRCGAVGALENFKNPSLVARAVMEHTDHLFLVGAGAKVFARDMGFEEADLLTPQARKTWMLWRETRSTRDSWGPGIDSPDYREELIKKAQALEIPDSLIEHAANRVLYPTTGTINCMAVNELGNISGVTTTSGLAWKISGRVGDSPVIGAGLFLDGEVGGGGSTGRGEENIRISGGHTVVEMMRRGMTPTEACLEALKRVQKNFKQDPKRLEKITIRFYALSINGAFGAASLWSHGPDGEPYKFAVHDAQNRLENCAYLLEGRH